MHGLDLIDFYKNHTLYIVFSELFRGNNIFCQKGLFEATGPIQCELKIFIYTGFNACIELDLLPQKDLFDKKLLSPRKSSEKTTQRV